MTPMDTIAAIATPVGTSGIGVIRISGSGALEVASRVFGPQASGFATHTAHHRTLTHPSTGRSIDEAVLTVFRAPASYTGEDVVEISCHGGIAVLKAALDAVLTAGARLAEPGEFTKRAFVGGKMDLAQAEAVNDLIRARTDEARKLALAQLEGGLSARIREIDERILGVCAAIEAAIDFPDDVEEPAAAWIEGEIDSAQESLGRLIASFGRGRIYREGLRVVIAGKVNVGKSSLLNALARHARAIVTPIPGTTRDLIEESLEVQGIPIVAIDTAGLRPTEDPIEKIGVELARRSLERADIVIFIFDVSEGVSQVDVELLSRIPGKPTVVVLNKVDLLPEEARGLATEEYSRRLGRSFPIVQTCASSGQGIDRLENEIAALACSGELAAESVLVTNARHHQLLLAARESLSKARLSAGAGEPIDMASVDLSAARNALGLVTGRTASEDLLDRIFSEFCIGK